MTFIELKDINKIYTTGEVEVHALKGIDLTIDRKEFLAIVGPSGCGKTTLLNLLGGIDKASSGTMTVGGKLISAASRGELNVYRRQIVSFIFQFFNLIPTLTALENVQIAAGLNPKSKKNSQTEAKKWLSLVGLDNLIHKFPHQLSGGEQQRVAIARSLAKNPDLLLADEPTGNCDSDSAKNIIRILRDLNQKKGITIILVTHNPAIANVTDKIIYLKDGAIFGENIPSSEDAQRFWT